MKKILLFIFLVTSYANAACFIKIPCTPAIEQANMQAQQKIQKAFTELFQTQNELDQTYKNYNDALKKQNELLQNIQNLKAENVILEKEKLFLLKQNNRLISVDIDDNSNEYKK